MFGANIVKLGNRGQRVENDPVGNFSEGARLQERQLWSRQFEPLTNKANLFRIRRPADRKGKRQEARGSRQEAVGLYQSGLFELSTPKRKKSA